MAEINIIDQFKEAMTTKLGSNYYSDEAKDNATYPYRVGSFNGSFDDEIAEVFAFELDYWDKGKSSKAINNLIKTDTGNGDRFNPTGLNGARFILPNGCVVLHKDGCPPVNEPDKSIRRARVSYMARIYYK